MADMVLRALLTSRIEHRVEKALVWLCHRYPYSLAAYGTIVKNFAQRKVEPELVATLRDGAQISVPLVLDGIGLYLAGALTGEEETTRLLGRVLRAGDTFLDIGAHFGFYAFMAAGICGPSGRVYAFEARPDYVEHLRKSVLLNGWERSVVVEHAAVIDTHNGTIELCCSSDKENTGLSSVLPHPWLDARVAVPTVSIDGYRQDKAIGKISVVKMDIEGAEVLALRGMRRTLTKEPPDLLIVELSPSTLSFQNIGGGAPIRVHSNAAKPWEVVDFLREYGYEPRQVLKNGRIGAFFPQGFWHGLKSVMNVAFALPAMSQTRPGAFAA